MTNASIGRMDRSQARGALLDAAEQVLADGGLQALSVRRVTNLAGMNVSAVNYSFGNKDALLCALMLRVMEPALAERTRQIEEVSRTPGHTIEDLVRAFLNPMLHQEPRLFALFVEIGLKPLLGGDRRFEAARKESVQSGIDQLVGALSPLLPEVPVDILSFRVELTLGTAFGYRLAAADYASRYQETEIGNGCLSDELINFLAQALSPQQGCECGTPRPLKGRAAEDLPDRDGGRQSPKA